MTTSTSSVLLKSWRALTTATVLALGGMSAAGATTLTHNAWGTNYSVNCTGYDALQFNATRNPGDGSPPIAGNTLLMKSDVTYWYPDYPCWESTTWTSNGTGRKAAKVTGVYENPNFTSIADFYLPADRFIKLRNLTIDNVDLDYDNMALWFFTSGAVSPAPDMSLTLTNGSITGFNRPHAFDSRANFKLTATGDSSILNWPVKLKVSSPTTLNVSGAGSKLTFFRVGQFFGSYMNSLFFDNTNNTALIDGATLKLDQSSITFGDPHPSNNQYGPMTFQNNATLELAGPETKLESGNVFFTNSSLKLGLGVTKLIVDDRLTFNGASADIAGTAKVTAQAFDVFGSNTIKLPKEYSEADYTVMAGTVLMHPDSTLTLNGEGSLASDFQLLWSHPVPGPQWGQIVINDNASLVNDGGTFIVNPAARITINRTNGNVFGSLIVKNSGAIELLGSPSYYGNVINQGQISALSNGALAVTSTTFNILGGSQGLISIESDGRLDIGNFGTTLGATAVLNTDNRVLFDNFSKLKLTIDPTARKNSQLRTSAEIAISNLAELNLGLVNDQVLPVGTKFVLIDYASLLGYAVNSHVVTYFNGYRDGSSFVLGLNRYQINYKDSGDAGFAGAVTLSVIPLVPPVAALSPTPQTINGTVGALITPSATMVPSNFGGTVTYSINPALPPGLKFDLVKGVISGTSSDALASTVFTIRGVGSTSGDANAIVNLTIAKANQTITFGPVPTATYSPSGVFLVSASASSALPITYSSTTPLVCSASGGSVTILSAGNCTVAANQAGDANYNAAPQVTQTITIAKAAQAPLTLIGVPPNITVSGTSALSTSGGSGTGAISYAVAPASASICSLSGATLTGLAVGTCILTATQAGDTNYNAITSSPLNIQVGAGALTPLFLMANPTSFGVNGTSALSTIGGNGGGAVTYAVSSGPCTIAPGSSTVTGTAVGQCQVVATKAADGSYGAATSNPVTLSVNLLAPSALVLSASPTTIGFGGSSTLSTTGGIPGGAVTYSVTGPCYVTGNTLTGTSDGSCQVSATQAATSVYSAPTSNTVTVTVKERTTIFSYPQTPAIIGQAFVLTPTTAGFTNPTFALLYGSMPAWATLNPATGVISGTPTGTLGTFDFVISVLENNAYDAALAVITVQVPAAIPTLNEWGLIILSSLMVMLAFAMRRKL
ncbi:MAG: IPTL-CTERM sorting domain-containing protein [Rhodoferax sp.]